jgi:hypothetical protein
MTLSIIQDITSTVYRIALSRQKQRKHLLHYGCACKIQHLVRRFLSRRSRLSIRSSYRSVSSGNSNSNTNSSNQKKLRYQARRPPPRVLSSAEEKDRFESPSQYTSMRVVIPLYLSPPLLSAYQIPPLHTTLHYCYYIITTTTTIVLLYLLIYSPSYEFFLVIKFCFYKGVSLQLGLFNGIFGDGCKE